MARLLLCDDSSFSRKILGSLLKKMGYEVEEVDRGLAAIEQLEKRPDDFDCLMLDLLMPEKDGFEVLAHLKQTNINTPVIVCSADIQDSAREKVLQLGAVAMVNKPCKEAQLTQALSVALNQSEAA